MYVTDAWSYTDMQRAALDVWRRRLGMAHAYDAVAAQRARRLCRSVLEQWRDVHIQGAPAEQVRGCRH